jgi:predicted RNA-binding Zn ribbon-like protein
LSPFKEVDGGYASLVPVKTIFSGYNKAMAEYDIPTAGAPLQVGEHLALDLLNTTLLVDGEVTDILQSDEDVLRWLAAMGHTVRKPSLEAGVLLKTARGIRQALRGAVEKKKHGGAIHRRYWNGLLARSPHHSVIAEDDATLIQRWGVDTAEEVLGPVIAACVDLLTAGDFELIRPCESNDCILWFYDRTKSHRRRWCSMKTCGNRAKVAAYRERQAVG